MTTENRRKEEAKTEDSGRNLVQSTKSAMVDITEKEKSILPDDQDLLSNLEYIPKIERVVSDHNIQDAIRAVIRNKGARA